MYKKIVKGVGVAVYLLPVVASAQVKLYGVVDVYAGSLKKSGDQASVSQLASGGMTTSFIGMSGQEELSPGTKIIFALEAFMRADTGAQGRTDKDPLFSRNAWLGVQGDWGTFKAGRNGNQTYLGMARQSAFGLSFNFSPLVLHSFSKPFNAAILGDTVWNNSLEYTTPSVSGLKASVMTSLGEDTQRRGANNYGMHVNYNQDRWNVQASGQRVRVENNSTFENAQTTWLLGASYRFDSLTVHANYVRVNTSERLGGTMPGIKRDTYDVGLTVPVATQHRFLAEVAYTDSRNDIAEVGRQYERTTGSVGYMYSLSKRSDAYITYMRDKKNNYSGANSMAIGLRHSF